MYCKMRWGRLPWLLLLRRRRLLVIKRTLRNLHGFHRMSPTARSISRPPTAFRPSSYTPYPSPFSIRVSLSHWFARNRLSQSPAQSPKQRTESRRRVARSPGGDDATDAATPVPDATHGLRQRHRQAQRDVLRGTGKCYVYVVVTAKILWYVCWASLMALSWRSAYLGDKQWAG